jgi:hypothetical protein
MAISFVFIISFSKIVFVTKSLSLKFQQCYLMRRTAEDNAFNVPPLASASGRSVDFNFFLIYLNAVGIYHFSTLLLIR